MAVHHQKPESCMDGLKTFQDKSQSDGWDPRSCVHPTSFEPPNILLPNLTCRCFFTHHCFLTHLSDILYVLINWFISVCVMSLIGCSFQYANTLFLLPSSCKLYFSLCTAVSDKVQWHSKLFQMKTGGCGLTLWMERNQWVFCLSVCVFLFVCLVCACLSFSPFLPFFCLSVFLPPERMKTWGFDGDGGRIDSERAFLSSVYFLGSKTLSLCTAAGQRCLKYFTNE